MTTTTDSITVKLFAGLEARTRERRTQLSLTLAEAPTVGAIGGRLGLEPGVTGLVLVNGVHARDDQRLESGDEVSLFPPLGGG
jgi:molybdopterin converting factor small subunit